VECLSWDAAVRPDASIRQTWDRMIVEREGLVLWKDTLGVEGYKDLVRSRHLKRRRKRIQSLVSKDLGYEEILKMMEDDVVVWCF
jgi:hypothetical protein